MTVMESAPARRDLCVSEQAPHPRPRGQDRYTISEVVAWTGLTAHTLRWYERIGLMPDVDRSHTGQRRYSNRDLDWLSFVGRLRLTGMPVADMVRYAEMARVGDETFAERRELLAAHREDVRKKIADLREALEVLDFKIGFYSEAALPAAVHAGAADTAPERPHTACQTSTARQTGTA